MATVEAVMMRADLMQAAQGQIKDRPVTEQAERLAVVQEALTWLGTPWHHQGRVKGAGVDCAMLLAECYEAAGLTTRVEPEPYPQDWHLHQGEELFQQEVERHAAKVDRTPLPGDIVLYRFGRTASHGAIVVAWPQVIHAYLRGAGEVILDDAENNRDLSRRFAGVWSPWGGDE